METRNFSEGPVGVIGAGVMGVGIVQVALLAGHAVHWFDAREGAAAAAATQLASTLATLAEKGKVPADAAAQATARLRVVDRLADLAGATLVIEAIVEQLEAKRGLLRDLEAVVGDDCVLASNTSSLSITALARGLRRPARVAGLHFFNPVPLMRLVEVVSGLSTDPAVADALCALARAWGKTPVAARSTPGFIVNRIARPFYAEALALLQEQAGTPAQIDACLRGAGFRMGPCELMDLIGHDTNFAVTHSVYEANFFDKRYQPSLVQRELVDGGLLGRKSGRGFYDYSTSSAAAAGGAASASGPTGASASAGGQLPRAAVVVGGEGPFAALLAERLAAAGAVFTREAGGDPGLRLGAGWLGVTDGRTATELAAARGVDDLALIDWPLGPASEATSSAQAALAFGVAEQASEAFAAEVEALLAALGWRPQRLRDAPGLVVARTIAMLVNEAGDAVEQGVCDRAGADTAMTLGVNYPAGPFAWAERFGVPAVVSVLEALDACYRGERYRVSPLWRRAHGARAGSRAKAR